MKHNRKIQKAIITELGKDIGGGEAIGLWDWQQEG